MQWRDFHRPVIETDGGPWAEHDQACAVCTDRHAVLDIGTGLFHPCWNCQDAGWHLVCTPSRWRSWLRRLAATGNAQRPSQRPLGL